MNETTRVLLLLPGLMIGAVNAYAGPWQKSLSIPVSVEYESNPRMASGGSSGVTRTSINPKLVFDYNLDVDQFIANLAVNETRSSDTALSANRTDPNVLMSWRHQMEKGGFSLSGKYDRASTRATEFKDTGYVLTDSTRTFKSLYANGQYALSERDNLTGHLEYDRVAFSSSSSLTSYKTTSGSMTFSHAWSDRLQPYFTVNATRYEPDNTALAFSSTQYMGQAGVKWLLDATWDATVYAGAQRYSGARTGGGGVGGIGLHHAGDLSDLSLKLSHSVSASGLGGFVKADQVNGNWGYSLSERNRLGADLMWRKNYDIYRVTIAQAGLWFSHEIAQNWSTKLTYRHRTLDQSGLVTNSDMAGISLVYQRPDL